MGLLHHPFVLFAGHTRARLELCLLRRTQLREMADPQDHSPDLLRFVVLSESWHPSRRDAVSNYEIQLAVRPFLSVVG